MKFVPSPLAGSYMIEVGAFNDERGWFSRYYCAQEFKEIGHTKQWVQLNHSFTAKNGTVRGMHYQQAPFREIKMVKCIAGAVYDVIVDLRKESPTFLQWFGLELSAVNKRMIYIPEGFAHGFQTLTDDCELIYHHTEFYNPNAEAGIRPVDPALNISWPLPIGMLSVKDASYTLIGKEFKGI